MGAKIACKPCTAGSPVSASRPVRGVYSDLNPGFRSTILPFLRFAGTVWYSAETVPHDVPYLPRIPRVSSDGRWNSGSSLGQDWLRAETLNTSMIINVRCPRMFPANNRCSRRGILQPATRDQTRGRPSLIARRCPEGGRQVADFADTAAIISQLDMVITTDTAVAHLAGALGKPVWLVLGFVPAWRWLLIGMTARTRPRGFSVRASPAPGTTWFNASVANWGRRGSECSVRGASQLAAADPTTTAIASAAWRRVATEDYPYVPCDTLKRRTFQQAGRNWGCCPEPHTVSDWQQPSRNPLQRPKPLINMRRRSGCPVHEYGHGRGHQWTAGAFRRNEEV